VFVRFVGEELQDGVEGTHFILLFVIPMGDPREVAAAEVSDEESPEEESSDFGAAAAEIAGEEEQQQEHGDGEDEDEPADLVHAKSEDGGRGILMRGIVVREADLLEVGDDRGLLRGVNQAAQHAGGEKRERGEGPFAVEAAEAGQPVFELGYEPGGVGGGVEIAPIEGMDAVGEDDDESPTEEDEEFRRITDGGEIG